MLEQCWNYSKQCRNNVATLCCAKNRRCESSRVTSPLAIHGYIIWFEQTLNIIEGFAFCWFRPGQIYILLFIHHIRGETVLFIIQTSDRMQYFTIFEDKLHSVNIQDDQSWALSETVQKFPKSPIRPAGSRFYSASCQCGWVFEWTLIELCFNIMANLLFFLVFNGFSYNDVFDTRDITKGTDKRLKLQERLLTIKKRNIIRWNIYRDNNFHSRRQVLKCLWKSLFMF